MSEIRPLSADEQKAFDVLLNNYQQAGLSTVSLAVLADYAVRFVATLQRELADARAESERWRTFVSGKILAQIPEREHPTYMDMEDLSLCLDQFKLDPWMVKVINAMRHALNDLAYARERAAASAPGWK